jgi:hypothetical protein
MPWTIEDVDRFKSGLSRSEKRRWVRIANAALSSCISEGGNDRTCASSAIRQANGIVGNEKNTDMKTKEKVFETILQANSSYEIRNEVYEGKEYVVVPVVMMVEGVHSGSRGAIFHPAEELAHMPMAFDGIPVTINHPKDKQGNYISANSPEILKEYHVGRIFGTYFSDEKLKGEAWLDTHRLAAISPEGLSYIVEGYPLEVSIAIFNDEDDIQGEWNGETYEAVARNYRPDHLALLPGGQGACSWLDGCGIRANQSNIKTKEKGGSNVSVNKNDKKGFPALFQTLKELNNEGIIARSISCLAEKGYKELVDNARNKLDRMDDDMKMHFLEEMYEDYLVYEVRRRDGVTELYRRDYSVNESGEIDFTNDPVSVNRTVEYVVQEMKRTKKSVNNKKGKEAPNMSANKHECPACEEKIVSLIANESTKYVEEDREWLQNLSEEQLEKLLPVEGKKEQISDIKEKSNDAPDVNADNNKEKKISIKDLPAEDQAVFAYGKQQLRARQEELIAKIQANAEAVWTDKELQAKELSELEKIAKSVQPVGDYSAAHGSVIANAEYDEEVLMPTGYDKPEKNENK